MAHHIPKITYGGLVQTAVVFDYPPKEDNGDRFDVVERIQTSVSGVRQVQVDHTEAVRPLKFSSVSETTKSELQTFFLTHGQYGKAFRYYENKDSASYEEYELKDLKFAPKRIGIRGENLYAYEIPLTLRRVVGVTSAEDYVTQELLNNQAVGIDLEDLILDSSAYRSAKVFFEIFRKTDSSERVANGYLTATYKESTATWDITPAGVFDGDEHGVEFEIDSTGQIAYTSDNMAGANYEGEILLRDFTIEGN